MASVSLAEARAYLGIDGSDHDVYLAGMRRLAEAYVRRLTIVGDSLDEAGAAYLQVFPDDLQLAQLLMVKFYFDRRENPADAKSPPGLAGYITGWERGVGNPNEKDLRVHGAGEVEIAPITPPPTGTETYYFALKGTQDITAADLLAGLEIISADIVAEGVTETQFEIPDYPAGVTMAYMGLAIPHGRALTELLFDPEGSTQIATAQFPMQSDIVIGGESYSWYESRTTYFNFVIGFRFEMHVEDV